MLTLNCTLQRAALLIMAFVFSLTLTTAQSPFVKLHGNQEFQHLGKTEVHDNSLFVTGITGDGNAIFANFSRFDLNGNRIWTVQIPEVNTAFSDFVRCDEDGNFLLVGSTYPRFNPNTNNQSLLAKITPVGTLIWWRLYPNNGREGFSRIVRNPSATTPNTFPYYILGIENTTNSPSTSDVVTLYNLDFNGNFSFKRRYTGSDAQFSSTLLVYPSGTMALGGEDLTTGRILWVNQGGAQVQANNYGPQFISWYDLKLYSNNQTIGVGRHFNLGNNDQDGLVARLDPQGRQVWAARIPAIQYFYRVTQPDDSGIFYAMGYSDGVTPQRNIVVKFQENPLGGVSILWSRHLDGTETAYVGGYLGLAPNGNLLYADGRTNNPNGFGQRDGLLAVLNTEFASGCTQDFPLELIPLQLTATPVNVPSTSPAIPNPSVSTIVISPEWEMASPCSQGCGDCATDEIVLNTGYDPINGTTYPPGAYDGLWTLVTTPDPGITVPRPAYVVNPNTAWSNQTNTGWISAYPQSNLNSNNPKPQVPYGFQRCFCICDDESDITISLNALADNNLDISLTDDLGNPIGSPLLSITDIGVGAFQTVTSSTTSFTLNAGTYCLRADLRNLSGVAMGLNIQGSVTGENLVETLCCHNEGSITGSKFNDLDCNGKWDLQGPAGAETAIPNWQIVLCDSIGNPLDTVLTDAFGFYTFPNLPPGNYFVKEINQPGWTPSVPASGQYAVTVTPFGVVGPLDFGNCQSCGEIVEETIDFSCDPLGSYEYTFYLHNITNPAQPVTSFAINDLPAGYTFSPQFFSQWTHPGLLPIPPSGVSGPFTVNIIPPAPITTPTQICFDVVLFSENVECCHFEHCITLEPIDPCQVDVTVTQLDTDEGCCFLIDITNDYCDNFFTVLVTEILTPGVTFGSYSGGSTWNVTADNLGDRLSWTPAAGGFIPNGITGDIQFCLDGIMSQTQIPQEVAFHWMSVDPITGEEFIACSDTLQFECQGCLIVSEESILCNEDGTYAYSLTVTNNSNPAHFVSNVILEVYSTTVTFTPNVFNVALNGGQSANLGPITIAGGNAGDVIWFKTLLLDTDGWCCHLDSLSITLPPCNGCDCPPFEEYVQNANAGFTFTEICPEVNFSAVAGTECDLVIWEFFIPGQAPVTLQGPGNQPVSYTFPSPGGYGVCMTLVPLDANGKRCYEEAIRVCEDIIITCENNTACIDPAQIDLNVLCPAIFEPVCGCDGVTYSNSCAAENWGGVTSWTAGPCPQTPNVLDLPHLDQQLEETRPVFHIGLDGKRDFRFVGLMRVNHQGGWETQQIESATSRQTRFELAADPASGTNQYEIWGTDSQGRLYRSAKLTTQATRPEMSLFPNPVKEELNILLPEIGVYRVEVYNTAGNQLAGQNFEGQLTTIPVTQLPDGVYILRVTDESGRVSQERFVKTTR